MGGDSQMLKMKSFTKVTLPIAVRRNGSYDDLVASVIESRDLDYASSDVVINYLAHSREKVHPTIINNDKRVSLDMMDVDVDGFRPILRINIVERPFEESLNSSPLPPRRLVVDGDLNDYENDDDHPINIEDNSMNMKYDSSDSQDVEEDCGTGERDHNQVIPSPIELISTVI
ncbi:hypothetical protein CQW23_02276 [Capsicum baccatum]|uniref:Uncharacterized protein n=1 Tax=Capsicum baccatum TaxID=33114 RepID=A0A2G2XQZ1_CAPBA|nr:hypothetical protein CQW23_02276 [Capsicum baccatum]